MGKGIDDLEYINYIYTRRVTFKKRRIGLIKKAMQLNVISGCQISLRIYNEEDGSLMEYYSDENEIMSAKDDRIKQHAKILNTNQKLCNDIEKQIVAKGHLKSPDLNLETRILNEIEGFELLNMFTISNNKNKIQEQEPVKSSEI